MRCCASSNASISMTSRPEQAGFVLYIRSSRLCTSSDEIHYHLAILPTAPGVESLTSKACRYCVLLLVPKKLSANDLTLPWRPLYDRFYREVYPSARQRDMLGVGAKMLSRRIMRSSR
ncbi:hypothetical protein V8E36_005054 [Tilletia maclaganii]